MEGYIVSTINTSTSGIQNYWQVNNNKLEQTWKTSKETSIQQDKTDITSAKTDELDEAKLQEAITKWQSLTPGERKILQKKTMANSFLDTSKDGLIQKTPQAIVLIGQIALMIAAGTLMPPLLPALGLGAIAIAGNIVLKDVNKRVQANAQAKALSDITGIEPQYAKKVVELQNKAMTQQKEIGKFLNKAMKDEDINKWVTDELKKQKNDIALEILEDGKHVKENFKQLLMRKFLNVYQPESAKAREVFLNTLMNGLISEDKRVLEFLASQPKDRQEIVKHLGEELKAELLEKQKQEQAVKDAQALTEQQQMAIIGEFTSDFIGDEKLKGFTKEMFKDKPGVAEALYSDATPQELKMQIALAAFTQGIVRNNPEAIAFADKLGAKYPPHKAIFLNNIFNQNIQTMQQMATAKDLNTRAEEIGYQIAGQTPAVAKTETAGLSTEEQRAVMKDFTEEMIKDEKVKSFIQNVVLKDDSETLGDFYNSQIPTEAKEPFAVQAFAIGLLQQSPEILEFNEKITPKFKGQKEDFLNQVITKEAEKIQNSMSGN